MDAKPDSEECKEAIRLAGQATCTCHGESTNLIDAAGKGCLKCSTAFIGQVGKKDWLGRTALMLSAEKGHLEVAQLLIPHEAKMQDNDGWTALIISAQKGHLEVAKFLVEHEAGIKSNGGRTATTYAISSYQPSCLPLLLANDAELKASQIPRIMLAALDGDIRYLLSNQDEWSTKYDELTALDFALLGNQRRAVRLLVGSQEARRSFAEKFGSRFDVWNPIGFAYRFLSAYASSMLEIAPAVHLMGAKCKSWLLVAALIEQLDNASHILRAICTPDAESMFQDLEIFCDELQIARVLAGLKHVGFSKRKKTMENLAKKRDGPVQKYLTSDPLKQAQTRRAKKEAGNDVEEGENDVPNKKQAAFREIGAESAFNGSLVTESRNATQSASASCRLVHDQSTNSIKHKQARINILLAGLYQFMYRVVQEMLDE